MAKRCAHPGQALLENLRRLGVTPAELARQLEVPPNRISQIINGKRAITGDTALRLAHWFGTKPDYWLRLQAEHDVEEARARAGHRIERLPTSEPLRRRAGGGTR